MSHSNIKLHLSIFYYVACKLPQKFRYQFYDSMLISKLIIAMKIYKADAQN